MSNEDKILQAIAKFGKPQTFGDGTRKCLCKLPQSVCSNEPINKPCLWDKDILASIGVTNKKDLYSTINLNDHPKSLHVTKAFVCNAEIIGSERFGRR